MFIVSLNYIKPLEEIEKYLPAHIQFLEKYYAQGNFVMSGRKIPRTGGVIIINAENRAQAENIISEDPFHQANLAEYTIIEFIPSKTSPDLAQYQQS